MFHASKSWLMAALIILPAPLWARNQAVDEVRKDVATVKQYLGAHQKPLVRGAVVGLAGYPVFELGQWFMKKGALPAKTELARLPARLAGAVLLLGGAGMMLDGVLFAVSDGRISFLTPLYVRAFGADTCCGEGVSAEDTHRTVAHLQEALKLPGHQAAAYIESQPQLREIVATSAEIIREDETSF